jgi:hypothetical protein
MGTWLSDFLDDDGFAEHFLDLHRGVLGDREPIA